jgi:hypothetical protein
MHTQRKVLDKNGRVIADKIVPDGGRLTVPTLLMDNKTISTTTVVTDTTVGHRPGSLPLADADRQRRESMYRKRDAELSERWKITAPSPAETVQLEQVRSTPTVGAG